MSTKNDSRIACMPVAEGVRFQIGHASACAVRNQERDISVRVRREGRFFRGVFGRVPFLRGIVRLFGAIADFFSGLSESARLEPQSPIRGGAFLRKFAELFSTTPQTLCALGSALAIPVLIFGFLVGLPLLAEAALLALGGLPRVAVNGICCALRIIGAVLALYAVCRLKVVNRLCMYRGAASKVLNAYEAYGPGLSHEEATLSSRLTDRSDGAFLIVVLFFALIGFVCFRTEGWLLQLAYRAGVVLVSAAVVNELILPLERAKPDTFLAALRTPLVGLQHLFTIEPHTQMIEVAVVAFRAAYENDIA